jgi:tetratricopeptide (TPR) repeat protein
MRECSALLDSLQKVTSHHEASAELSLNRVLLHQLVRDYGSDSTPTTYTDTTAAGLISQGVNAAAQGDLTKATEIRESLAVETEFDKRRYAPDAVFLDAWIAAAAGQWDEVTRTIGRSTTTGQHPTVTGRLPQRWLLARAHEELHQYEEAVRALNLVLDPTRLSDCRLGPELFRFGIPHSFAHHRLVLLYSKMGRVDDARRHWEIFERTFTDADPELAPMLDEARHALAEAEEKHFPGMKPRTHF